MARWLERQIRTVRNVLEPLLLQVGMQLNDESLCTFLAQAEFVINSRPLTTENINNSNCSELLTPNHLLTIKPKPLLPLQENYEGRFVCSEAIRKI